MTIPRITLVANAGLLSATPICAQPDQLIRPTYNDGPPEPYYKPRPLTPEYVEWLRKMNYLPPEEFDHEYKGELKIVRGTEQDLRKACPNTFKPGNHAIGCTYRFLGGASCTIYIVNDNVLQSINWDIEIVLRHERAHCNGWHHEPPSGVKCWANSCD
jgi:hypothetical protein